MAVQLCPELERLVGWVSGHLDMCALVEKTRGEHWRKSLDQVKVKQRLSEDGQYILGGVSCCEDGILAMRKCGWHGTHPRTCDLEIV